MAKPARIVTPDGMDLCARVMQESGLSSGRVNMSNAALAWPKGHRVAVVVSVLLETWSEGKSPSYFPRTTPLPPVAGSTPAVPVKAGLASRLIAVVLMSPSTVIRAYFSANAGPTMKFEPYWF